MTKNKPHAGVYEQVLKAPENFVAEMMNGELVAHRMPGPKHIRAASALGACLAPVFDLGKKANGGWWILDNPEMHFGDDIMVPDLAGWRRERMPQLPGIPWFEPEPDWVCEVLSPSMARIDRVKKMPLYAAHGVRFLWLVDPENRLLEVFELGNGHWMLLATLADNAPVSQPPFESHSFPLDHLWT